MKTYPVLSQVVYNGTAYPAGGDIELDEATAGPLLKGGAIGEPEASGPDAGGGTGGLERVVEAIAAIPDDDPELWTKSGKPQVGAIAAVLGEAVTAAQRDEAWAAVQEAAG